MAMVVLIVGSGLVLPVTPAQQAGIKRTDLQRHDLHRRIKGSELVIYPDSGHGGIFQFHEKFVPVAVKFLDR